MTEKCSVACIERDITEECSVVHILRDITEECSILCIHAKPCILNGMHLYKHLSLSSTCIQLHTMYVHAVTQIF